MADLGGLPELPDAPMSHVILSEAQSLSPWTVAVASRADSSWKDWRALELQLRTTSWGWTPVTWDLWFHYGDQKGWPSDHSHHWDLLVLETNRKSRNIWTKTCLKGGKGRVSFRIRDQSLWFMPLGDPVPIVFFWQIRRGLGVSNEYLPLSSHVHPPPRHGVWNSMCLDRWRLWQGRCSHGRVLNVHGEMGS